MSATAAAQIKQRMVGNDAHVDAILEYLNDASDASPAAVLIAGPSGSGKTTLCHSLFEACNIQPLQPTRVTAAGAKDFRCCIDNFSKCKTLSDFFNVSSCKVVFVDDIDIQATHDRSVIAYIAQVLDQALLTHPRVKYVLTATVCDKRLTSKCLMVHLTPPSRAVVEAYMQSYVKSKRPHMTKKAVHALVRESIQAYGLDLRAMKQALDFPEHSKGDHACLTMPLQGLLQKVVSQSSDLLRHLNDLDVMLSSDANELTHALMDVSRKGHMTLDVSSQITLASTAIDAAQLEYKAGFDPTLHTISYLIQAGMVLHLNRDLQKHVAKHKHHAHGNLRCDLSHLAHTHRITPMHVLRLLNTPHLLPNDWEKVKTQYMQSFHGMKKLNVL